MKNYMLGIAIFIAVVPNAKADLIIGFDELTNFSNSGPTGSYYNGYGFGAPTGSWVSQGATFNTRQFGPGWSYSNVNAPNTPGFTNQFSAASGTGVGGSGNYALANGYRNIAPTDFDSRVFNPNLVSDLFSLPYFTIPDPFAIRGLFVTNATYPALSMRDGDSFSKKFGGFSGNDPDWFKLSAYGVDALGNPLGTAVDFYLADFRNTDNTQDYIVNDWRYLDLTPLSNARTIHFNLSSSDFGNFGMNTPGYFAIDNITLSAVPEPHTFAIIAILGAGVAWRGRRKRGLET